MKKFHSKIYYYITFLISFLIILIRISGNYSMRLVMDDISCLSAPAYLSGYDWSSVLESAGYKGAVYYFVFCPIMKLVNEPTYLWFFIILVNNLLLAFACVLSYHCLTRYLQFKQGAGTAMVCVSGLLCVQKSITLNNEYPLYLLSWIIIYVLIRFYLSSTVKGKMMWMVLDVIVCTYAYLVHTRALVFYIACACFFVGASLRARKKGRYVFEFIGIAAVLFFIGKNIVRKAIINCLYGEQISGFLNTEIPIESSTIGAFFSVDGIRTLFDMIIGNLITTFSYTNGIGFIIVLFAITTIWRYRKEEDNINFLRRLVFDFSFISFAVTLVGLAVIWGKPVVPTYSSDTVVYHYKGFSYFRYYGTFLGPAMVISLAEVIEGNVNISTLKKIALIFLPIILFYHRIVVINQIKLSIYASNCIIQYFAVDADGFDYFNYKIFIIIIVSFLFIFLCKNKKYRFVGLGLAIGINTTQFIDVTHLFISMPSLNSGGDAGYYLIKYFEDNEYTIPMLYCSTSSLACVYQYQLKEYPIIVGVPEENNTAMVFTRSSKMVDGLENYRYIKLDEDEYVWTNDEAVEMEIGQYLLENSNG